MSDNKDRANGERIPKERKDLLKKTLMILGDVWFSMRVLRELHQSTTSGIHPDHLSDRELLTIRLVQTYADRVTEKTIATILGMQPSAVNMMVGRLVDRGLLKKEGRGRPLSAGPKAESSVQAVQIRNGGMFFRVLSVLGNDELDSLNGLMSKMGEVAKAEVNERVFGNPELLSEIFEKGN